MNECICNSCKNLKSIVDENATDQNGIIEVCEFDFPSDNCLECEVDGCELTCDHYVSDIEEEKVIISKCAKCGVELKLAKGNDEDSEVYCFTCYLNK